MNERLVQPPPETAHKSLEGMHGSVAVPNATAGFCKRGRVKLVSQYWSGGFYFGHQALLKWKNYEKKSVIRVISSENAHDRSLIRVKRKEGRVTFHFIPIRL